MAVDKPSKTSPWRWVQSGIEAGDESDETSSHRCVQSGVLVDEPTKISSQRWGRSGMSQLKPYRCCAGAGATSVPAKS